MSGSETMSLPVCLYVFSGPHLGARVELGEGRWVLGCDDACDIILSGLESRHAVLDVGSTQNGVVTVTLTALDGALRSQEGDEILPGQNGQMTVFAPKAGEAWYLGLTCLAWNLAGIEQPVIMPEIARRSEPQSAGLNQEPASVEPPAAAGTGQEHAATPLNDNSVGDSSPQLPEMMSEVAETKRQGFSFRNVLLLICVAVALAAMSVAVAPRHVDEDDYPEIINQYLHSAGIKGLSVNVRSPGVEVRGAVENDESMLQLRDMARALHIPVYLEVAVREDVLRAVRSSLGIRGFHPRVSIEDTGEGQISLRIAAYMKDKLIEKAALAALAEEVRSLPPLDLHIVHEQEVAPVLEEALKQAGLSSIHAVYLPGQIDFAGNIPPADGERLEDIRRTVGEHFGVDVYGNARGSAAENPGDLLVSMKKSSSPRWEAGVPASASGSTADPLNGLRVTGVTMSPMRFVTMADGKRLFEGAVLPGGWTLESIDTRVLVFRRGEHVVSHRLRGN